HEVIAVGRGRDKSHENNEDTDSVQGDHTSFFSEIILQDQCGKECKKNQANTRNKKDFDKFPGLELEPIQGTNLIF
ncbi:16260_t:CDS:1, partial [Entrophospora sp. SA101]